LDSFLSTAGESEVEAGFPLPVGEFGKVENSVPESRIGVGGVMNVVGVVGDVGESVMTGWDTGRPLAVLGRFSGFSRSGIAGTGGVDSKTLDPLREVDVPLFRPANNPPTTPRPPPTESRSGLDVGLADFLEDPLLNTSLNRPAGDRERTPAPLPELGARLSDTFEDAATSVDLSTDAASMG
jgi:hypothetical protein